MMVSSLVPSPKRKSKHKSKQDIEMPANNGFKSSKKRKEPSAKIEVAPLYKQDLGTAGVKKAKPTKPAGPILKGPESQKFSIAETSEEKLRRLRRQVRSLCLLCTSEVLMA